MNDYIATFLCTIVIVLHMYGMRLIVRLLKANKGRIQHILILNMSCCITVLNILQILYFVYLKHTYNLSKMNQDMRLLSHMMYFTYVHAMILVTLDRTLGVFLNMRYPMYVTRRRVVLVIAFTSVLCITTVVFIGTWPDKSAT